MAGGQRRGGGAGAGACPDLCDGSDVGMARNRSAILGLMYGYYKEALDALPLKRVPSLGPRLLHAGVCFGFGDPVSNIIANTVLYVLPDEPEADSRKRERPDFLSSIVAAGDAPSPPEADSRKRKRPDFLSSIVAAGDAPSPPEARTIAERSVDGLVTFLTTYFRYLPKWDALRYLYESHADLLLAVRLIELDRCCHLRKDGFHIDSHAAAVALKCAALSAGLSNVDGFLSGSAVLVAQLTHAAPGEKYRRPGRLSVEAVRRLSGLLEQPHELDELENLMDRAAMHRQPYGSRPARIESLRALLLDRIHIVYMEAMSRIPMDDLRKRYHHGLLKAGYCYGPFDPVLNVIINTLWYDSTFPAPQEFESEMICTKLLIRLESLSLHGLIDLMLSCVSDINEHEVAVYLLKSDLKLAEAICLAAKDGYNVTSWDGAAYKSAADKSSHPESISYVEFVMESLPRVRSRVTKLLTVHTLSSRKITVLSKLLSSSKSCQCQPLEPTIELTKDALEIASSYKENFFNQQNSVRKKVEATLQDYEQRKEHYELRFICAVNQSVGRKSFRDLKYPYSHVNFWASQKDGTSLTLFFAQVSNDDGDDKEHHWSFCHPVASLSTNARCCYCDFQGTRILHPNENHCGGAVDFEEMALGRHKLGNEKMISHEKLISCPWGIYGEEYIYFDPARDVKFIRSMNRTAWEKRLNWDDEVRRRKRLKDKRQRDCAKRVEKLEAYLSGWSCEQTKLPSALC